MNEERAYSAFLSYSHRDTRIAERLHRQLETYRLPRALRTLEREAAFPGGRLFPVFRDRDELPTSGDLSGQILQALTRSRTLIVLCSPHAAHSLWVEAEIRRFVELGRADRILPILIAGEPNASLTPGIEHDECLPAPLRNVALGGTLEPHAADLRPGRDQQRLAFLRVVAAIVGVDLDDLVQRDRRRQRRRLGGSLAAGLAVVGSVAGWIALLEREQRRERAEALARQAEQAYRDERHEQALRLGVLAAGEPLSAEAATLLGWVLPSAAHALGGGWRSEALLGETIIGANQDAAGRHWLVRTASGALAVFDARSGALRGRHAAPTPEGRIAEPSLSLDGSLAVSWPESGPVTFRVWHIATDDTRLVIEHADMSGRRGAALAAGGRVVTWSASELRITALDGRALDPIPLNVPLDGIVVTPDGARLAGWWPAGVLIIDLPTAEVLGAHGLAAPVQIAELTDGPLLAIGGPAGWAYASLESGALSIDFGPRRHPQRPEWLKITRRADGDGGEALILRNDSLQIVGRVDGVVDAAHQPTGQTTSFVHPRVGLAAQAIYGLALDPDGTVVVSWDQAGSLFAWHPTSGFELLGHREAAGVADIAIGLYGGFLLWTAEGGLTLVRPAGGIETVLDAQDHVYAAAFSGDAQTVLSIQPGGRVRAWNRRSGRAVRDERRPGELTGRPADDGAGLVTGSFHEVEPIALWDGGREPVIDAAPRSPAEQEQALGRPIAVSACDAPWFRGNRFAVVLQCGGGGIVLDAVTEEVLRPLPLPALRQVLGEVREELLLVSGLLDAPGGGRHELIFDLEAGALTLDLGADRSSGLRRRTLSRDGDFMLWWQGPVIVVERVGWSVSQPLGALRQAVCAERLIPRGASRIEPIDQLLAPWLARRLGENVCRDWTDDR